jgi:hypothetical protein
VLAPELRTLDRVVFRIAGGALVARPPDGHYPGTFELREVLGGGAIIAAVADYEPRLPWWLYLGTQAQAHRVVMALFGRATRDSGGATKIDRPFVSPKNVQNVQPAERLANTYGG